MTETDTMRKDIQALSEEPYFKKPVCPRTTKPKRSSKTKQLRLDSNTGVNPKHTHGLGIWGNERVVMSIRVDKGLKKEFKPASKALFGSTCNPIESWMAGIVGVFKNQKMSGVNPSTTVSIGEIKIERNLRERRRLEVDVEPEVNSALKCGFTGCEEEAISLGVYKGTQYRLCFRHLAEAKNNRKVWTVLQ